MRHASLLAFSFIICLATPIISFGLEGRPATSDDIQLLKKDILSGKIQVGNTRLSEVRTVYGIAASITDNEKKLVMDYGDLKVEFDKKKVWKSWDYDTFKNPLYTDKIDDLRFDLESEELVGKNITFDRILKDYGEPTESMPTDMDGQLSVFYYGDIKMTFENLVVLKSWKGKDLDKGAVLEGGILKKTDTFDPLKENPPVLKPLPTAPEAPKVEEEAAAPAGE